MGLPLLALTGENMPSALAFETLKMGPLTRCSSTDLLSTTSGDPGMVARERTGRARKC